MYVSPGSEPPWRFCESRPLARPIVAFAWLYGAIAPVPEFIWISRLIGPLTTAIAAMEDVVLPRALAPVAASARITGRYSGRAPAITAFTATFSTVYFQYSRK